MSEIESLKSTMSYLCGYVSACEKNNTDEYMKDLVVILNKAYVELQLPDRVELIGNCIRGKK